jgi:CheY-like chemotaxis protein/nitrogen-specific signal transduction histidine kinase
MGTVQIVVAITGLVVIALLAVSRRRLTKRLRELEVEAQRARDLDGSRGQFLAYMSHEVRTPLTGILGTVKLMQMRPLDAKMKRYVETIDASANALLGIVNHTLQYSKLDAGRFPVEKTQFSIHDLVRDVAELFSSQVHEKGVEMVYRIEPSMPAAVLGHPGQVRQILTNFVGNAAKFTDKGEVFVDATLASRGDTSVVVRMAVHDSGVGIASEDVSKLFEPFTQVGDEARRRSGTGLGLAISKRLAEAMGGDVSVESKLGVGSVFAFTVALELDTLPGAARSAPAAAGSRRRVLVAEPSRRTGDVIAEQLRGRHIECEVAAERTSVAEQVTRAEAAGRKFDVVVEGKSIDVLEVRDLATGTVVSLNKPVRFAELMDSLNGSTVKREPGVPQPTRQGSNGTVLVAEDDEVNRFVVVEELELRGYRVEVVANGAAAVERVKRGGLLAVLMDCEMPRMDGYTATKEIRQWETSAGAPRVPIIALTAHALAGERDRALEAGMDAYVSKPLRGSSFDAALAGARAPL